MAFVGSCGFARVHVFPYSERPGTRSSDLSDDVPPEVKKERVHAMREVAETDARRFVEARVGQEMHVLWERRHRGWVEGTSDEYVRCRLPIEQADEIGTVQTVRGGTTLGRRLDCVVPSSDAPRRLPVI
jgi:threonylcarbamoyladenosine tRNA methylthiotransferase MtaB